MPTTAHNGQRNHPPRNDWHERACIGIYRSGGNDVLSPLHDARKTSAELGEEEAMPITGPHDKPD